MPFSTETTSTEMAEKKIAYQHSAQSCSSFYTAGWDIKEARRLIEESQHLNPRPIVIFVHPSVNQLVLTRDRQNNRQEYVSEHDCKTTKNGTHRNNSEGDYKQ